MIKRSEKGSITLFTLIAMMFFLTIAFTAYASAMAKLQAQNEDLERIKASYEQDLTEEGLRELYNKLTGTREWLPGDGTEQNPYKIYTIEDLVELSNRTNSGTDFANKYIDLMNDLDFNDVRSYEKFDRTDFGDINEDNIVENLRTELTTEQGWQSIGTTSKRFRGIFNGNNYMIKNLYINTTKNNQGLFGYSIGTIKNIIVNGSVISTGNCIGGIVGYSSINSKVLNCISYINVQGNTYIGGVAGEGESNEIEQCYNYGDVNGRNSVSGLVGYGYSSKIRKCLNRGNIKTNDNTVSGICAYNFGSKIEKSFNNGKIEGRWSGGISGYTKGSPTIENCFNTGIIQGNDRVKGIVAGTAEVKNCYNMGEINGISYFGSIGGTNSNCYYLSTLSATDSTAISKTATEMKLQAFVDLLNTGQADQPWAMDTYGINDGYPVLKWQNEEIE